MSTPSDADVAGDARDQRRLGARRREQRDVAGHHHHVEGAAEVEGGEVGLHPGEVRGQAAGGGEHRRVDVGADHLDAVARPARWRRARCRSRRRARCAGS